MGALGKMAAGNVQKNLKDYSVYFATFAFCSCLLYAYASCADTIAAIGSEEIEDTALSILQQASAYIVPLGFFSVTVFCFLASYANRFIVRRRKQELGMLQLMGMGTGQVWGLLCLECGATGAAAAAAGIACGILLAPVWGLLASWAFRIPWRPVWTVSVPGIALASAGFFAVAFASCIASGRELRRSQLIDLMQARHVSEAAHPVPRGRTVAELAAGLALLALGYGICLSVVGFLAFMVPMVALVLGGSWLVIHSLSRLVCEALSSCPRLWYRGLTSFVVRHLEAHMAESASAVTTASALLAVGVCALGMAAGIRGAAPQETGDIELLVAAGSFVYIILFFGLTFLVAAFAVLALQQLAEAEDEHAACAGLMRLGASGRQLKGALAAQASAYFLAPAILAVVHDMVGFVVARSLLEELFCLPSEAVSFPAVLALVLLVYLAYLGAVSWASTRGIRDLGMSCTA